MNDSAPTTPEAAPTPPPAVEAPVAEAPPPRPGPKQLARALNCTVEELAHRTLVDGRGVNRRTLYRWFDAGAPFDSEANLRRWLANNGAVVAPLEPTLAEVVATAVPGMTQNAPTAPAGQEASAPKNKDGTDLTTRQQADLAAIDARRVRAHRDQLEIDEKQRILIHRDAVIKATEHLAMDVLRGLVDLTPKFLRRLGDGIPGEHRPALRAALDIEVAALRAQITKDVPARLTTLLNPEGITP